MKELFKAIDESLENNDSKWYELYKESNLTPSQKQDVLKYIKGHYVVSGAPSVTPNTPFPAASDNTFQFLKKADKELIKKAFGINSEDAKSFYNN